MKQMEKKKHLKHRTCYVSRHMSAPRLFKKRKEQKKKIQTNEKKRNEQTRNFYSQIILLISLLIVLSNLFSFSSTNCFAFLISRNLKVASNFSVTQLNIMINDEFKTMLKWFLFSGQELDLKCQRFLCMTRCILHVSINSCM